MPFRTPYPVCPQFQKRIFAPVLSGFNHPACRGSMASVSLFPKSRTHGVQHEPWADSPFIRQKSHGGIVFPPNEAIMLLKNKALPFLEVFESHEVVENKGSYMLKAKRLLILKQLRSFLRAKNRGFLQEMARFRAEIAPKMHES
jgi:hypothetical protein